MAAEVGDTYLPPLNLLLQLVELVYRNRYYRFFIQVDVAAGHGLGRIWRIIPDALYRYMTEEKGYSENRVVQKRS